MREELEKKLIKRFPAWFGANGDARHALVPCGFGHGDGWFDILWRLCVDLEPLATDLEKDTGERFEVLQVKERLGALCFYVSHHSDAINERIVEARMKASHTCEICGEPGNAIKKGGRIRARCEAHAQLLKAQ